MAKWAKWMFGAAAVDTLLTLVGIALILGTLIYTKQAAEAARDAVKEAREATAAAEESVAVARNTAKQELRAYLSVEPGGINQLIASSDLMGHVQIHNVGKLPAQAVTPVVRMTRVDTKLVNRKTFRFPKTSKATTRVVQPGVSITIGCRDEDRIPFSTALIDGGYLFVWGVVFYRDGYDESRFTRFCHRYHWESRDRTIEAIYRAGLPTRAEALISSDKARYHPSGNEAD